MSKKLRSELQAKYLCGIINESQYHEALAMMKDAYGNRYKVEESPDGVSAVYHGTTDINEQPHEIEELWFKSDNGEYTLARVSLTIGHETVQQGGALDYAPKTDNENISSITVNASGTKILMDDDEGRPPSRTELRRILDVIMMEKRYLDHLDTHVNRHNY